VERRRRGITLPELIAVTLLVSIAASAVVAIPAVGRDRAQTFQAAAAIEAAVAATQVVWETTGQLPAADTNPDSLTDQLKQVAPGLQILNAGERSTADGPAPSSAQVLNAQANTTVSVAWLSGTTAAAVAISGRDTSGNCLLTRVDFGDRASPQRYGVIPADTAAAPPCQGDVAMTLPLVEDLDRAGASWANPTRVVQDTTEPEL